MVEKIMWHHSTFEDGGGYYCMALPICHLVVENIVVVFDLRMEPKILSEKEVPILPTYSSSESCFSSRENEAFWDLI